jgi:hypothetical protein
MTSGGIFALHVFDGGVIQNVAMHLFRLDMLNHFTHLSLTPYHFPPYANMLPGYSIGDIIASSKLAWELYCKFKNSTTDYRDISCELASVHLTLKETHQNLCHESSSLTPDQELHLSTITNGCNDILRKLEAKWETYDSLGTRTQRTWDRLRFAKEDVTALRLQLVSQTTAITAFNTNFQTYLPDVSDYQTFH